MTAAELRCLAPGDIISFSFGRKTPFYKLMEKDLSREAAASWWLKFTQYHRVNTAYATDWHTPIRYIPASDIAQMFLVEDQLVIEEEQAKASTKGING